MAGKRKASSTSAAPSKAPKQLPADQEEVVELIDEEIDEFDDFVETVSVQEARALVSAAPVHKPMPVREARHRIAAGDDDDDVVFVGEPVPDEEARKNWPHRYRQGKGKQIIGSRSITSEESLTEFTQAVQHYTTAKEGPVIYTLGDDAHVQAGEGEDDYICKIIEMFKGTDGVSYFRAQWYYRAKDTAIKSSSDLIDNKRVFFSEIKDDNPLGCLLKKLNIIRLPLHMNPSEKILAGADYDFYCDMVFHVPYSTFMKLPNLNENLGAGSESDSTISSERDVGASAIGNSKDYEDVSKIDANERPEMTLLDLYAGCGGMSTGLSLGAKAAGANLVTKWAVDINQYACESLRHNHPETHVRNESAEDFLELLKIWMELCETYIDNEKQLPADIVEDKDDDGDDDVDGDNGDVYEVEEILDICYGDPNGIKKPALYFKIKWKNYGPEFDTWEPREGLADCEDRLKEFVVNGHKSKILPLPGSVDMICGGPPCQGISGFNRFREKSDPFKDEKNKQLVVYMDIIKHLKPKFVLMENVVDILKFAGGLLGRYALGRLIGMNYQTRLGMMAAGSYGLPQFRMRVFLWGARPSENLPQFALPSYNCVFRGVVPTEFESSYVRPDVETERENSLFLKDAISDLPPVGNYEERDEIPYEGEPQTFFQRFIRSTEDGGINQVLFDHRPLQLNTDDYQRVCQIPKNKGANFRDLKGVMVGENNTVKWNPDVERVYLPSGKPLVPEYAMSYIRGTSSKPFGRLWWDETVPTVVTRAEPHNQIILHPLQDRVLTIRENARLQGFPDHYKLFGPVKERYIQVGNAVAVPVSRALGYGLGLAIRGIWSMEPVFTLPKRFPNILEVDNQAVDEIVQN